MNRVWFLVCSAGALLLTVTGCPPTDQSGQNAQVRFMHASPDAPAVDVCIGGSLVFENVTFPVATSYARVAAGTDTVRVVPTGAGCGGAAVLSATLPLEADTDTTVIALGRLAALQALVLHDDNSAPPAGQARVRFVQASPDTPTVDLTFTDGATLVDDLSFGGSSGYLTLAAGSYVLEMRDPSDATLLLTLEPLGLTAGRVYTVFFVGLFNGLPELSVYVTIDRS